MTRRVSRTGMVRMAALAWCVFVLAVTGSAGAAWVDFNEFGSGRIVGQLSYEVGAESPRRERPPRWMGIPGEVRVDRLPLEIWYQFHGESRALERLELSGLSYWNKATPPPRPTHEVEVTLYWETEPAPGEQFRLSLDVSAALLRLGRLPEELPREVLLSETHEITFVPRDRTLGGLDVRVRALDAKAPPSREPVAAPAPAPVRPRASPPAPVPDGIPTYVRLFPLTTAPAPHVELVHRDGSVVVVGSAELAPNDKAGCYVRARRDVRPQDLVAVFGDGSPCTFESLPLERLGDGSRGAPLVVRCDPAADAREEGRLRVEGVLPPWRMWEDGTARAIRLELLADGGVPIGQVYVPPSGVMPGDRPGAVELRFPLAVPAGVRFVGVSLAPGVRSPVGEAPPTEAQPWVVQLRPKTEWLKVTSALDQGPVEGATVWLRYSDTGFQEEHTANPAGLVPVAFHEGDREWETRFQVEARAPHFRPWGPRELPPKARAVRLEPEPVERRVRAVTPEGEEVRGQVALSCPGCPHAEGEVPGAFRLPWGARPVKAALRGELGEKYLLSREPDPTVGWGAAPDPFDLVVEERCPAAPWAVGLTGLGAAPPATAFAAQFGTGAAGERRPLELRREAGGTWRLVCPGYNTCLGPEATVELRGDPAYEDLSVRVAPGAVVHLEPRRRGVLLLIDTSREMDPFYFEAAGAVAKALEAVGAHPKLEVAVARGPRLEAVYRSGAGTAGRSARDAVREYLERNRADVNADLDLRPALGEAAAFLDRYNEGGRTLRNRVVYVLASSVFARVEEGFRPPANADGLEIAVVEIHDPEGPAPRPYARHLASEGRYRFVTTQEMAEAIASAISAP